MSLRGRRHHDFQLAYLVHLTRDGIKPLSRWEKRLDPAGRRLIRRAQLTVRTMERRTRMGRRATETIFARDPALLSRYQRRFSGTRLSQSPVTMRTEGQLFGYPACCIEAFIARPYTPNGLSPGDQRILFHWACPECVITPRLLPDYRRVHDACRSLHGTDGLARARLEPGVTGTLARIAASLALLAGSAGIAAAQPDPHWLPANDDADLDGLSFAEEILRGTDWFNADTDGNQVQDGVQIAQLLFALIANPPPGVIVEDHPVYGVEACHACGELVNMGYVTITHEQRGLTTDLPYMALHYLERGSLGYDGEIHAGRVDLDAVKRMVLPCDPAHQLPREFCLNGDQDDDGLCTEEERVLGTAPDNPDTDGDSLADGPQVAEELMPLLAELPREVCDDRPYMLEHRAFGLENCTICGAILNMGHVEIVNPLEGMALEAPFVGLHSVAHGSWKYAGSVHDWRIIPTVMRTVLAGQGMAHWMPVPDDRDGDGLRDEEEPFFDLDPDIADEDGNGVPDGRQLAMQLGAEIHALPDQPQPHMPYVQHFEMMGVYDCLTCGETINMGYLEISNPLLGIELQVPYYTLHYMDHGGFSTDREDLYPRIDPRDIGTILMTHTMDVQNTPAVPGLTLWNAPNPFTTTSGTEIGLSLPGTTTPVTVAIYDTSGRQIRRLFTGELDGKASTLRWDGTDDAGQTMSAGIYHCRVSTGAITITRKIALIH